MKNPYTEALEAFTFNEMASALDAISQETQPLEFKESIIAAPQLAYRACSLANAEGGLILIGIRDPVEGQPLAFGPPPLTDDKERLRLLAAINSRTYPGLPIEKSGYRSSAGDKAILVLRVSRSMAAPHEFLGSEQFNLPIRRAQKPIGSVLGKSKSSVFAGLAKNLIRRHVREEIRTLPYSR